MCDDFDDIDIDDILEGDVPEDEWLEEMEEREWLPDIPPIIGIKRHRLQTDGEGITTLVALHGCPLACSWCLNPQCHNSSHKGFEQLTAERLYGRLMADDLYFRYTGGGVTFGGGEPLLYPDYISHFCDLCSGSHKWKVNVETSLNIPKENLKKVMLDVNCFMVDIKDMNPTTYRRYTGNRNTQVKENLRLLAENGLGLHVVIRVPLIEGYNTEEDVEKSISQLKELGYEKFDRFSYINTRKHPSCAKRLPGRLTCEALKKIRKEIADRCGIEYNITDCHYEGDCPGTCPKCERELRWLTYQVEEWESANNENISLLRNNIFIPRKAIITFQDQVDDVVERVLRRVKNEMPGYGRFPTIMEHFPNRSDDIKWVSKYGLHVKTLPADVQPDPMMRYIIAVAYEPSGNYKADMAVAHGHKEEIIRILEDPEFAKRLNGTYGELVEILEDF